MAPDVELKTTTETAVEQKANDYPNYNQNENSLEDLTEKFIQNSYF